VVCHGVDRADADVLREYRDLVPVLLQYRDVVVWLDESQPGGALGFGEDV
jgi:hypothetical protein